ncbi:MAG: formate dehydrogenase subunit alpha [Rhodospirillaceae bacterium]|jgi:formate dehydrogenase major subunit|nr:formate dehydrogenase subunit alpha [Rhodospirillaceae bacterium]MBT7770107.1 formate dehydrogenase subunit alpha [Rhodospirillales bacterium]MBT5033729.1 formate dehydrogenase subunit alpha [Rhodospirillaceae bacterium]MBT6221909.1 formate dehydrogenase subunit alpha [Rhodospirillaceae bacterium]MBT6360685.1 formate dehydrogenase subunit alpha [Rhodospirillaceae bacterium]
MSDQITFSLNGIDVTAEPGETIWQVADRLGIEIPHLCYSPKPGYRADGNCRACMVEIEGERVLAASCIRPASEGMKVNTVSDRAKNARKAVFELLLADQPKKETAHDPDSNLWKWTDKIGLSESRYPARDCPSADNTHPAMGVNLDACIHCNLCVRACREVQVNDVIGMAGRGIKSSIVFDMGDGMGDSTCVACGECVQACPTGALMPSNVLDENGIHTGAADRQVNSLCPFCGVGCQVTFNIRDDKILFVEGREGPSNKNRLCVKGRFGMDYVHHPERLTVPLIRKEGVAKDAADVLDPANPFTHFREATWEEALDKAAEGLSRIRDRDGAQALAGFGSAKGSNEEAYMVQKLVRTGFQTNNVDHCTRLCHASSVAALMEGIGSGAVTAPFMSAKDADVIIVIGARPTQNHPVAATFFKNAAQEGKTLIIMDPRRQALSRHADHMLQFTPGRDVPLLNAMIHTIIEEGLTDENYIKGYTEGYEDLKAKVKDFSPEKMAEICGIDAETIRTVARKYATAERSIIFWGMGISQHVHGTDNARCLIALSLITGHVGRPGTGLHPLRGQNNVQGASDAGLIPMLYPDYQSVENDNIREKFETAWGTELDRKRGLTVVEIADAAYDRKIKGIYVMGENPAMSDPNAGHAREAMARLEHLVVQDIFLTETAFLADVILPATAFPEKDGTFSNTNRQVQLARQAVNAPGDARQDWWIIQEIANRIGLDWSYTHPKDVFTEMHTIMPSLNGITWERLEREDSVTYPCDSEDVPGHDIVFGDGFPTASKRGKLVPTEIVAPYEMPDEAYPLILTTGRMLEHWHTGAMTRRSSRLDALEPVPVASFHPNQLDQMNIGPGDTIKVASRRGEIEIAARADRDVPDGMVFIPFCFNEAAANLLTSPQLDPIGKIPEFKFCAVKVEKVRALVAAE